MSCSGYCPSHHLRVFLFVVIAVMISVAMQNTENPVNTKQDMIVPGKFQTFLSMYSF